jgi:hypothetical protein
VIAPLTITQHILNNIGTMVNLDSAIWAEKAKDTFERHAESYASTSAVLLGLQMAASPASGGGASPASGGGASPASGGGASPASGGEVRE